MLERKKTRLRVLMICAMAFGCSAATLSGTFAALDARTAAPAKAPRT